MLSHSTLDKPIFFLFFEKMYKIFGQSKKKQYLCALFRLLGSKVALLRGRMMWKYRMPTSMTLHLA